MSDEPMAFIAEDVEFDGGIHDAIARGGRSLGSRAGQRVVVRIAGEEPYVDAGRGEGRALRRRRPAGWEFLDRTSADPPIMCDVIVERAATIPAGPVRPNGTWTGYAAVPHSIVQVEVGGYEDALTAAVAGAPPELTATRAFPTGSRSAQVNARLDADDILF